MNTAASLSFIGASRRFAAVSEDVDGHEDDDPNYPEVAWEVKRAVVDYEPDAIQAAKPVNPSRALAASANISNMELAHVKLSGDRAGEYVVTEERPDGSLTLVPDTSFDAIRKRLGTEPGTLADFESEYGPVQPPDGEG